MVPAAVVLSSFAFGALLLLRQLPRLRSRQPPVLQTACGVLEGSWDDREPDVAVYANLRYAEAPVGEYRWQPPRPAVCLEPSARIDAERPGPACVSLPGNGASDAQSEDCLSLDVRVPSAHIGADAELLPVIFWIHGGSLVLGDTTMFPNQGFLAQEGFVVVTPNYRLATLGFLALPSLALGDPRGVSGNYGLLDQAEALRWVQRRIGDFSGDARRVSVMGQSSGGTSIYALYAMPEARELFSAAVALSGSPNVSLSLDAAYAQNGALLSASTCGDMSGAEQLACLRALPMDAAAAIFPPSFSVSPEAPLDPSGQRYPGLPIVDGVSVVASAEEAMAAGLVRKPMFLMSTETECESLEPNASVSSLSEAGYAELVHRQFDQAGFPSAAAETVLELYAEEVRTSRELAWFKFQSDYSMLCGNVALAKALKTGAAHTVHGEAPAVYLAYLRQAPSNPLYGLRGKDAPPSHYAAHCWDYIAAARAWDLFHQWSSGASPVYEPTPADVELGDRLRSHWLELARTGHIASLPEFGATGSGVVYVDGAAVTTPALGERCAALAAEPLGLDRRFWLTN